MSLLAIAAMPRFAATRRCRRFSPPMPLRYADMLLYAAYADACQRGATIDATLLLLPLMAMLRDADADAAFAAA